MIMIMTDIIIITISIIIIVLIICIIYTIIFIRNSLIQWTIDVFEFERRCLHLLITF